MSDVDLNVDETIDLLVTSIQAEIKVKALSDPVMIGIHTGGTWIAEVLHERLSLHEPLGMLDISFYRDDFSEIGVQPQVRPSKLPFSIEGRDILLVDDVLYTGRTIRAALNEIFDYGRPANVLLGVLIERDGRQIPIQADCVGARVDLKPNQRIKLTGPDPLKLSMHEFKSETA